MFSKKCLLQIIKTNRQIKSSWKALTLFQIFNNKCLKTGQTIATCQHNISQHCWAQHVACVWPPCCDVLQHVGYCWLKFENGVKFEPTTPNMSQQSGQMDTTCCAQQCCDMLRWHVAIRRLAGALITNETSPKQSVHLEVKRSLPDLPC